MVQAYNQKLALRRIPSTAKQGDPISCYLSPGTQRRRVSLAMGSSHSKACSMRIISSGKSPSLTCLCQYEASTASCSCRNGAVKGTPAKGDSTWQRIGKGFACLSPSGFSVGGQSAARNCSISCVTSSHSKASVGCKK